MICAKIKNVQRKKRILKVRFFFLFVSPEFLELDESTIAVLKTFGQGPYAEHLKQLEVDVESCLKRVNELCGIKESDTGLSQPALWDIAADKQIMQQEQPLQVRIFILMSIVN